MPGRFRVLQLCTHYADPFPYLCSQYAHLFENSPYKITTVYLCGQPEPQTPSSDEYHEVIFLNLPDRSLRGLKLSVICRILKLHLKYQFAFCICHRPQSLYIATHIPKLKVIGVIHGFGEYKRWGRRLWVNLRKKNLALLGISNGVRDELRKCFPNFPRLHIQTLFNSVDPQKLQQHLLLRKQARDYFALGDYFWFVNIGRLVPEKDQATLIRGFSYIAHEIPNARLAIIGQGSLAESLQALCVTENIADKITFLGNIPECYRYLLGFDSFVLSSISEGFGMVLLEAMVAGLPIISSDLDSLSEVLGDTAWRFKTKNPLQLSEQMKLIYKLKDAELEQCQVRMYQRVVDNFSTESMRKQFWQLPFLKNWKVKIAQGRNRTGTGD